MRQLFSVAFLQFRITLKSKGTLLTMFAMPLLLTLIFGMLVIGSGATQGKQYPIGVVDQDGSFVSQELIQSLEREPSLRVQRVSITQMNDLFRDHKLEAGLIIPAEWQGSLVGGRPGDLSLVVAPGGGNAQLAIRPLYNRNVMQITGDFSLAQGLTNGHLDPKQLRTAFDQIGASRTKLGVALTQASVKQAEAKSSRNLVGEQALGFTVMFVMMTVFNMSGVILGERQTGTWGRLLTTPTRKTSLIGGYLTAFFLTGMFQFGVLVLLSSLIWQINWGPLLPLTVMSAALVLCATGLGLFLAGVVRTSEQQRTVGSVVVMATSMLGGVFWPLDLVGETMRKVGYFTPQAWAMDGFRVVMFRGGAWSGLMLPLTVLLFMSALFLTAGLFRVRFE